MIATILNFPARHGRDYLAAFEFRCGCGAISYLSILVKEIPAALFCGACGAAQLEDWVIDAKIPPDHLARVNEAERF